MKLPQDIQSCDEATLRAWVYHRGWEDEEFFFDFFVPHWRCDDDGNPVPSPRFHAQLRSMMDTGSVLAVIPRGYGKTTNGKLRLLRRICYATVGDTCLWMSTPLLKRVMTDLRREIEDNIWIGRIFGDLTPKGNSTEKAKRWNESVMEFAPGGRIEGISKCGSVRGGRYDEIWADDVQENKDVRNPAVAEEFEYHFRSSVLPALKPKGRVHVTGTNVGTQSLIHRLWEDDQHNLQKILYPAIADPVWDDDGNLSGGGELLWPERFDLPMLQQIQRNISPRVFRQEFLHQAWDCVRSPVWEVSDGMLEVIKPVDTDKHGVVWYQDIQACRHVTMGIDLARGGMAGDYTAFVIRDENKNLVAEYAKKVVIEDFISIVDHVVQVCGRVPLRMVPERNSAEAFFVLARGYGWFGRVMYRAQEQGNVRLKRSDVYGWQTSASSKRLMIDRYGMLLRGGVWQVSATLAQQIRGYMYDDAGSANAKSGTHDDLLIADMLTCVV